MSIDRVEYEAFVFCSKKKIADFLSTLEGFQNAKKLCALFEEQLETIKYCNSSLSNIKFDWPDNLTEPIKFRVTFRIRV